MKKVRALYLLSVIVLVLGCRNKQSDLGNLNAFDSVNKQAVVQQVDLRTEMQNLNNILMKFEQKSQTFSVLTKKPIEIKGKKGTVIYVNPSDLVTESGEPVGDKIDIELKELNTSNQLLKANAQTVSDGKLLVSGGAYYINMTSDGKQLKLKDGKTLKVEFPKLTKNEMSLFYGQRDSFGQINWKNAEQTFKPATNSSQTNLNTNSDYSNQVAIKNELTGETSYFEPEAYVKSMNKKERAKYEKNLQLSKQVYEAININQFGWINCDRFYNSQTTNLYVYFKKGDSIITANNYLIFKDLNSVIQRIYCAGGNSDSLKFENIPVGKKVRLLSYSVKNQKVYVFSSDLIIQQDKAIPLTMKETGEADFKKLIGE